MTTPPGKSKIDDDPVRKGPSYPYYAWTACVKLAEAVKDLGGSRKAVATGDIAHHMAKAEDSAMLSQLISSARTFRLIQGRGEFLLTEEANKYFYPTKDGDKRAAELSLFISPPVFAFLVNTYDGSILPSKEQLGNVLMRECKVPPSWKERAALLFMDGCKKLNLLDTGGHLRYAVAVRTLARIKDSSDTEGDKEELPPSEMDDPSPSATVTTPAEVERKSAERKTSKTKYIVWTAPNGDDGEVRVETPDPLPQALWEKLNRYVQVLKPD